MIGGPTAGIPRRPSLTRGSGSPRVSPGRLGTSIPAVPEVHMAQVQHAQAAILLLSQAKLLADDLEQDSWAFAVEINCLLEAGLTNSELRWLLGKGLVEHAHETTLLGDERRT